MAVACGRDTFCSLETLDKVAHVIEAKLLGDALDRLLRIDQQIAGIAQQPCAVCTAELHPRKAEQVFGMRVVGVLPGPPVDLF